MLTLEVLPLTATADADWTAEVDIPRDASYAVVGFAGASDVMENHLLTGINIGGLSILKGTPRADLVIQSDLREPRFWFGPGAFDARRKLIYPGIASFPIECGQKITVTGTRVIGSTNPGGTLGLSDFAALVLRFKGGEFDLSAHGRPTIQSVEHSWSGNVVDQQKIPFEVYASKAVPVVLERYSIGKNNTTTPAVMSLGTYHTALVLDGLSLPFFGRAPAAALAQVGPANAGFGRVRRHVDMGDQMALDVYAAADGSADDKTAYHVLQGWENRWYGKK